MSSTFLLHEFIHLVSNEVKRNPEIKFSSELHLESEQRGGEGSSYNLSSPGSVCFVGVSLIQQQRVHEESQYSDVFSI